MEKVIKDEIKEKSDLKPKLEKNLQDFFNDFKIKAKVENVLIGPTIITYEIKLEKGISIIKIKKLRDDLALYLGTRIIDINTRPEKKLAIIETERIEKEIVNFEDIIQTKEFKESESKLTVALGKEICGKCKVLDIEKTSNILISGISDAGIRMFIHTFINSILKKSKSNEVKFLILDNKFQELAIYNGIPNLLIPVISDNKRLGALSWLCSEMENILKILENNGLKDIEEYNKTQEDSKKMPKIVVIINEYADLIEIDKKQVEQYIYLLTRGAEKVGIYVILATETPSLNLINGKVKANISTRIAFKLLSSDDSKIILDTPGAEKLFGKGDMLLKEKNETQIVRCQSSFISDEEIQNNINTTKQEQVIYNEGIIKELDDNEPEDTDYLDPLFMDAVEIVVEAGQVSISFLQRKLRTGYARTSRIIDQMEERGIISWYQGSKPREVLITKDELEEMKNNFNK